MNWLDIENGSLVKVVHCDRDRFMNNEFLVWINEHKGQNFKVLEDLGRSVRLAGVNFAITKDFLIVL